MPNYCRNYLTITGDLEELKRFECNAKSKDGDSEVLSFDALCSDWYKGESFGTRREPCETSSFWEDDALVYSFDTASCSISRDGFMKIISDYPTLHFELLFAERGMSFLGKYTNDECWSVHSRIIAKTAEELQDQNGNDELFEEYKEWEDLWNSSG